MVMPIPEKKLLDFIKKETAKGVSRPKIETSLAGVGWPKSKVSEAFNHLDSAKNDVPDPVSTKTNVFRKAWSMVSSPQSFFTNVHSESVKPALLFYTLFVLVSYMLLFLVLVLASPSQVSSQQFFISLGILLLLIASSYLGIFFYALIMFLVSKIFKRDSSYAACFKTSVYPLAVPIVVISLTASMTALIAKFSLVPDFLVIVFQVINVISILYALALQVIGLSNNLEIRMWKASIPVLVVALIQVGLYFLLLRF